MTENTLFTLDLNEMQLKIVHEALEMAFGATINNQTNQWEVKP